MDLVVPTSQSRVHIHTIALPISKMRSHPIDREVAIESQPRFPCPWPVCGRAPSEGPGQSFAEAAPHTNLQKHQGNTYCSYFPTARSTFIRIAGVICSNYVP